VADIPGKSIGDWHRLTYHMIATLFVVQATDDAAFPVFLPSNSQGERRAIVVELRYSDEDKFEDNTAAKAIHPAIAL
jgi:hypothetical protein